MRRLCLALFAAAAAGSAAAAAPEEENCRTRPLPALETYESNNVGWTDDSDDVGFLDINLSFKYPLGPCFLNRYFESSRLYFAASARFAQYLGTRESSPVIGKRFNPKLIWRLTSWDQPGGDKTCNRKSGKQGCEYLDFAYAHESNGQSVNSPELFRVRQLEAIATDGNPEFARDYLSRGWDYVEVAARKWWGGVRFDPSLRYFLSDGLLQGGAEQYYEWENDPEGKTRRKVQGLALLATRWWTEHETLRLALGWETGTSDPFRYNTFRAEAALKLYETSLVLFYRNGYGSDLSLYYKRTSSLGLAIEFAQF